MTPISRGLRPFSEEDKEEICNMLSREGVGADEMFFDKYETWVWDENGVRGFFTIGEQHGFPFLQHFCVKREHRDINSARFLVKEFVKVAKERHEYALINVEKSYLAKLIHYYFKVSPYGLNGAKNFLVGV